MGGTRPPRSLQTCPGLVKPVCPHAGHPAGIVSIPRAAVGSAERLLTSSVISASDRRRVVSAKRSRACRSFALYRISISVMASATSAVQASRCVPQKPSGPVDSALRSALMCSIPPARRARHSVTGCPHPMCVMPLRDSRSSLSLAGALCSGPRSWAALRMAPSPPMVLRPARPFFVLSSFPLRTRRSSTLGCFSDARSTGAMDARYALDACSTATAM